MHYSIVQDDFIIKKVQLLQISVFPLFTDEYNYYSERLQVQMFSERDTRLSRLCSLIDISLNLIKIDKTNFMQIFRECLINTWPA